jgi:hypothetical protein
MRNNKTLVKTLVKILLPNILSRKMSKFLYLIKNARQNLKRFSPARLRSWLVKIDTMTLIYKIFIAIILTQVEKPSKTGFFA